MKIQVISDLHLEHNNNFVYKKAEGADLLILAGDISSYISQSEFVRKCAGEIKTIMIMGNHEPLGYTIEETVKAWKDLNIKNLIILDNETVEIEGVHFIGTTLWSDLNADPINQYHIQNTICDYKKIINPNKTDIVSINDMQNEFNKSFSFVKEELNKNYKRKVLITHHLPTFASIHENYINSPLNAAFASDLSNLLVYSDGLELCVHGHMHNSCEYILGEKVKIVCNPRGYHDENKEFDMLKCIEL